jgi:hypothetical protein
MKRYVAVTGVLFAVLALVHVWRLFEEPHLARDPFFVGMTLLAAALSAWSWRAFRRFEGSA